MEPQVTTADNGLGASSFWNSLLGAATTGGNIYKDIVTAQSAAKSSQAAAQTAANTAANNAVAQSNVAATLQKFTPVFIIGALLLVGVLAISLFRRKG